MDAFATYAKQAASHVARPTKLVGVNKTRAEVRARYSAIVADMATAKSAAELDGYLASIAADIAQFEAELEFYWEGDGEQFLGLRKEIALAQARVDDGLDFPRWEPRILEEGMEI